MTSKIFRSTVLVAVTVLLCSATVILGMLYSHFSAVQAAQLNDELSLAATATELYGNAFLEKVESQRFRLTWINTDGTVLFDTQVDQTTMENHADREEFQEALQSGSGSSVRASSTLTVRTLYEARQLRDGTVLRISIGQVSPLSLILDLMQPGLVIILLAILLSALLARRMAKRIVKPLNDMDLEAPLKNHIYEEIAPLLKRIHQQHLQISRDMTTLQRRADEFEQITANMQEGLVLLDGDTSVLSINPTARQLFSPDSDCLGKSILKTDPSPQLRSAVNDALDRGHGSARLSRNGRWHQLDLSRIVSNGNVLGVLILTFDITERLSAEQLRKEFSANVSHELKTPLQSIIGSAELLESGIVQAEDVPRFVGRIQKEASRLVALIEDIIRLSQLDEGVSMPLEEVALLPLAQEVAETLAVHAAECNVQLTVTGEGFRITGVRRLLSEILYNLCENAIKYNVPGGQVTVCVNNRLITVTDTGIGIPLEHQERIFERFYRVDKSHSRQTGGTGLGLSIVKHAAAYHNARLELASAPGEGTTVTVLFP